MAFTLDRIEALAPDQASLAAARKLLKPSTWPTLAEGEGLAWGECQGSGSTPYRVVVSEADEGYKCTCEPKTSVQARPRADVDARREVGRIRTRGRSRLGKGLALAQARNAGHGEQEHGRGEIKTAAVYPSH